MHLLHPGEVGPQRLLDAAVVGDVLALRVDAVEAEPVVRHGDGGHPQAVRLDVAQVPHVSGLVAGGSMTHLTWCLCVSKVSRQYTSSGLKCPFMDLHPLVMSPSWWMWKPWCPGDSPEIFPRTFTGPVGPPI